MRLAPLLFLGLILGCSGASADAVSAPAPAPTSTSGIEGGKATTPSACGALTADACKPAFHVSTALELIGATRAFEYQRVSISAGKTLDIGDDLVADADLEVLASDLGTAGSECDRDCHAPVFRAQGFPHFKAIAGVTCLEKGEQPVREAYACTRVAIAKGTTFRLRAVIEDMHPSAPTYWAFIDFVEPCATTCGAGEVLCAASHTCYGAGYEACAYCEGRTPDVCACRAKDCGQLPRGAECAFDSSPDVVVVGTCGATSCQAKR